MADEFEISMRRDSYGGAKLTELHGSEKAFEARSKLFLLIHGYNVSSDKATRQFQEFENSVKELTRTASLELCKVKWPGDYHIPLISRLSYPWRVGMAKQCATDLAHYLHRRKSLDGTTPTEIVIIAHSLGCRLTLEALGILFSKYEPNSNRKIKLFLMAAAAPVELTSNDAIGSAVSKPSVEVFVLFSPADTVLKVPFPLGEWLAERKRFKHIEAIGLNGNPAENVWKNRWHISGYDHGDYWPSAYVQSKIFNRLGYRVAAEIPARPIAQRDRTIEERNLIVRQLMVRDMFGR